MEGLGRVSRPSSGGSDLSSAEPVTQLLSFDQDKLRSRLERFSSAPGYSDGRDPSIPYRLRATLTTYALRSRRARARNGANGHKCFVRCGDLEGARCRR